jgi:hypothetical protein
MTQLHERGWQWKTAGDAARVAFDRRAWGEKWSHFRPRDFYRAGHEDGSDAALTRVADLTAKLAAAEAERDAILDLCVCDDGDGVWSAFRGWFNHEDDQPGDPKDANCAFYRSREAAACDVKKAAGLAPADEPAGPGEVPMPWGTTYSAIIREAMEPAQPPKGGSDGE